MLTDDNILTNAKCIFKMWLLLLCINLIIYSKIEIVTLFINFIIAPYIYCVVKRIFSKKILKIGPIAKRKICKRCEKDFDEISYLAGKLSCCNMEAGLATEKCPYALEHIVDNTIFNYNVYTYLYICPFYTFIILLHAAIIVSDRVIE